MNYPSAGTRYAAWWGADSFQLGVYDLVLDEPQLLFRNSTASQESALRPHIAGDLLVWLHVDVDPAPSAASCATRSCRRHAIPDRCIGARHAHDVERLVELLPR